ncbi:hypothetical protein MASR2M70_12940 [Bacillota bacterium]
MKMKINSGYGVVAGATHVKQGIECQDKVHTVEKNGTVCIALADGAGSKSNSGKCAEIAINVTSNLIIECFDNMFLSETHHISYAIIQKVKDAINKTNIDPQSMASTLLMVAVKGHRFIAVHIGDGLIVKYDGKCSVLSEPENGAYRNETFFITDSNANEHLRIYKGEIQEPFGFMLMSDGACQGLYEYSSGKVSSICYTFFEWVREYDGETVNVALENNIQKVLTLKTKDDISVILMATELKSPVNNDPAADSIKSGGDVDNSNRNMKFTENDGYHNERYTEDEFNEESQRTNATANSRSEADALEDARNLTDEGNRYFHGRGVRIDRRRAISYYTVAANKGYPLAQRYLGYIYENGLGTLKDLKVSEEWYKMAKAQGDEYAHLKLEPPSDRAEVLEKGQEPKVYEEINMGSSKVYTGYTLADKKGSGLSQVNFDNILENVQESLNDLGVAREWYVMPRGAYISEENIHSYEGSPRLGKGYNTGPSKISRKKILGIVIGLIVVFFIFGTYDALLEGVREYKDDNEEKDYRPIISIVEGGEVYPPGEYIIGKDIPAGEYFLHDSKMLQPESVQINKRHCLSDYLYCMYITVENKDRFFTEYSFIKSEFVDPVMPSYGVFLAGKYKIGRDIAPGEYYVIQVDYDKEAREARTYIINKGKISNDTRFSEETNIIVPDNGYLVLYNSAVILDEDAQ